MPVNDLIGLISDIKNKKITNSIDKALRTEELVEKIILTEKWQNAKDLMDIIKIHIKRVCEELPLEVVPKNVMKHVLKIIREEYETELKKSGDHIGPLNVRPNIFARPINYLKEFPDLKENILNHLEEFKCEIEISSDNIAAQANEELFPGSIILTIGKSDLVEQFLVKASARKPQVFVLEGAPFNSGHEVANNLAKRNIDCVLLPDSHVFAIMSKVNHVIIGTHSVFADGGLRAPIGVRNVTIAAEYYKIPVIVLSHMFKLTKDVFMHKTFDVHETSEDVLPETHGRLIDNDDIDIISPLYDYIPSNEVTSIISNQGQYAPSSLFRFTSELYHTADDSL